MTQAYPGYAPPAYPPQTSAPAYLPPAADPWAQAPQPYAAPQYPGQGYPAPQLAPPPQPLAQGSLDDFFNQPSGGGGAALKFDVINTRYIGIVSRPLGRGDVQQQTNRQGVPQFFKDGRPKFLMKVPLQMQPSPQYPDGVGTWFVKGPARDELVRAMAEAGAPAGPPEAGAIIDVTYVGDRPIPGMSPQKQFRVVYQRPDGAPPAAAPQPAVAPPPAPAAAPYAPPVAPSSVPAAPAQPAAPAAPQPPADLSPEQQQLLAKLTGGN